MKSTSLSELFSRHFIFQWMFVRSLFSTKFLQRLVIFVVCLANVDIWNLLDSADTIHKYIYIYVYQSMTIERTSVNR